MKNKSTLLVFLQKLFILLFLISGPLLAKNTYLLTIELFAIALGAWAIITMMRKSKFSDHPEPAQNARLLDTGPYRYIRNPMYSAILLGFGALLLDSFSLVRLSIYIVEAVILLKKISIEETLLPEKFKGYPAYKSRTRRLIPFLY
ncbi:MAG: isoprenylcysteine carboxylmethyltransferase family protein [Candidatus Gottesmanbacteria bacterium]|nr:isoprenylcysteine carboxylmethyltransferase family protein [Candidatus Gottesmanbacteria bacterium]